MAMAIRPTLESLPPDLHHRLLEQLPGAAVAAMGCTSRAWRERTRALPALQPVDTWAKATDRACHLVRQNEPELLSRFLTDTPSMKVNRLNDEGMTPLMLAAYLKFPRGGNRRLAHVLVSHGADESVPGVGGMRAKRFARLSNNVFVGAWLCSLDKFKQVNDSLPSMRHAIMWADLRLVRWLVKRDPQAAKYDLPSDKETFSMLVGKDILAMWRTAFTVFPDWKYDARLSAACVSAAGHREALPLLRYLREEKILDRVLAANDAGIQSALVLESCKGSPSLPVLKYMVEELHQDVRETLPHAARRGSAQVLEYLLDHGAELEHVDASRTAIEEAAAAGRLHAVKLLHARGARLDRHNAGDPGSTPLVLAMQVPYGSKETQALIKYLLDLPWPVPVLQWVLNRLNASPNQNRGADEVRTWIHEALARTD